MPSMPQTGSKISLHIGLGSTVHGGGGEGGEGSGFGGGDGAGGGGGFGDFAGGGQGRRSPVSMIVSDQKWVPEGVASHLTRLPYAQTSASDPHGCQQRRLYSQDMPSRAGSHASQ